MIDPRGDETTAEERKAQSRLAWFAVEAAAIGLAISSILGPGFAVVFLAGWLWGIEDVPGGSDG